MINQSSRIFWHFTGSPSNLDWKEIRRPKDITKYEKKSTAEATQILKEILSSKRLLATATENLSGEIETQRFCCVTDIPIAFLDFHKNYYGEVAIGFRSEKIFGHFNPVLYMERAGVLSRTIQFIEGRENISLQALGFSKEDAIRNGLAENEDGSWSMAVQTLQVNLQTDLERFFFDHLKFSSFSDDRTESFYHEKEWRSIGDFDFDFSDVEAIILPKKMIEDMFQFLSSHSPGANVSVFSWEALLHM